MKTVFQLCITLMGFLVLFACEREGLFNDGVQKEALVQRDKAPTVMNKKVKSLPFRAKFFTAQDLSASGVGKGYCGAASSFPYFNVQKGSGTENFLGNFSMTVTFCAQPPASPDATSIPYRSGQGVFKTEDGHELYIEIPRGTVNLLPQPGEYQANFRDKFFITGGTGPYKNASGRGQTNSFVKFLPGGGDRTDHDWVGLIILQVEE